MSEFFTTPATITVETDPPTPRKLTTEDVVTAVWKDWRNTFLVSQVVILVMLEIGVMYVYGLLEWLPKALMMFGLGRP